MGDDGFTIEPGVLRAEGDAFEAISAELDTAFLSWQLRLAALGDIFGDDDPGRSLAEAYNPRRAFVEDVAWGKLVTGLSSAQSGLRDMAGNHQRSDSEHSAVFWRMLDGEAG